MKKIVGLGFLIACAMGSFAQKVKELDVPRAAVEAVKKAHSGASVQWEREGKDYEANFSECGKEMSCIVTAAGTIVETETVLGKAQLPQAARTWLDAHAKGKKLKEVARIEKADGSLRWEVEFGEKEVTFDASGALVKEEAKEKEDDKP